MNSKKTFLEECKLYDNLKPECFVNQTKIAEGSFGKVYKCEYKDDMSIPARMFALKKFSIMEKDLEEILPEIQKEIKILDNIRNLKNKLSSILNYYGYFTKVEESNEITYVLVFDFISQTLRDYLKNMQNTVEFSFMKKVYNSLLHALAFLQANDISHRDLKPENLGLDENLLIKLLDFGFARDFSMTKNNLKKIETTFGGSENYLAPEVFTQTKRKMKHIYKSDIFSFGLIILEIVTQEKIRHSKNIKEWRKSIKKNLEKFKTYYRTLYSDDKYEAKKIFSVVKKCLNFDYKERPDFIEIVKEDIKESPEYMSDYLHYMDIKSNQIKESKEILEENKIETNLKRDFTIDLLLQELKSSEEIRRSLYNEKEKLKKELSQAKKNEENWENECKNLQKILDKIQLEDDLRIQILEQNIENNKENLYNNKKVFIYFYSIY